MIQNTIAIIGTAGRKDDARKLTKDHFPRMVDGVVALMTKLNIDTAMTRFVSGGAAWADHIVVELGLRKVVPIRNIVIDAPCDFQRNHFCGHDPSQTKTAKTINFYHTQFSAILGRNTLEELGEIETRGGSLIRNDKGGFFGRNQSIADSVSPGGILIAYTFGSRNTQQPPWTLRTFEGNCLSKDAGLKEGGTSDTWDRATECSSKYHGLIGESI